MCIVSMVQESITNPKSPNHIPWTLPDYPKPLRQEDPLDAYKKMFNPKPDAEVAKLLKQALEILDRIDKKLGNTECKVEADKKKELLDLLEKYL